MNTKTLLMIIGILIALLAFGCSKKNDPAPVHKQSDYVGTYNTLISLHQVRFIVRFNYSIDNGIIDGNSSEVSIKMGANSIERVEINDHITLDFVINDIHYVGSIIQGQAIHDGITETITLEKY